MSPAAQQWLTDAEVEAEFRIPRGTLRYWRSIRRGPPFRRLGARSCLYSRPELEAWLESCAVRPVQQPGGAP